VDFRNTIVVMTSNVGSDLIRKETTLGFQVKTEDAKTAEQQYQKMKDKVLDELKRVFRPEFLNRVDATVVFHGLSREHIRQIVDLQLKEVEKQLVLKGVTLEVTNSARDWLAEKGYDPVFGARPLRRVIQNEIEDRLSEALLEGRFQAGDRVQIDCEDGEITLKSASELAVT
jgi:ATP-dependent Clp protease ATP-binding subunit ClpC